MSVARRAGGSVKNKRHGRRETARTQPLGGGGAAPPCDRTRVCQRADHGLRVVAARAERGRGHGLHTHLLWDELLALSGIIVLGGARGLAHTSAAAGHCGGGTRPARGGRADTLCCCYHMGSMVLPLAALTLRNVVLRRGLARHLTGSHRRCCGTDLLYVGSISVL